MGVVEWHYPATSSWFPVLALPDKMICTCLSEQRGPDSSRDPLVLASSPLHFSHRWYKHVHTQPNGIDSRNAFFSALLFGHPVHVYKQEYQRIFRMFWDNGGQWFSAILNTGDYVVKVLFSLGLDGSCWVHYVGFAVEAFYRIMRAPSTGRQLLVRPQFTVDCAVDVLSYDQLSLIILAHTLIIFLFNVS